MAASEKETQTESRKKVGSTKSALLRKKKSRKEKNKTKKRRKQITFAEKINK